VPAVPALIAALAAAVALVFWLVIVIGIFAFQRDHRAIRPRGDDPEATRDVTVSIVVPAHDEALVIEECLRSLLAQTHRSMEVVVVDDRSRDATGEIARRLAGGDSRLGVVRVDDLPAGWTGKTHALAHGVAAARGEWLLFTDADTIHQPGCLAACLRHAVARRVVLLSGWPAIASRGALAAATDAMCGVVLASWYQRRGAEAGRRFAPFANGQYLLVRRDAFERVGGFDSIKHRLLEDIALAGLMEREGLPFETVLLADVVKVRGYNGLSQSRRAWTRIFLHGANGNVRRLLRRAIALPLIALAGPLAPAFGQPALAVGVLAVIAMIAAAALIYRQVRLPIAWALFTPVAATLTALFLALAARDARTERPIEWHGARYPGGVR
jgi:cellulose synthase/poly-beta-1,6-N-acetylglucosamine synthase-like glycosyltransferase